MLKKCSIFVLLFVLLAGFAAQAKSTIGHDVVLGDKPGEEIAIPVTYECVQVIDFIQGYMPESGDEGKLNNPQDVFIDQNDCIYIADTGNNAVLKLDSEGNLLQVITEANGVPLQYPLGLYVDEAGDIFIADNGNARILHLDKDGVYIEEFVAPESELLSQNLATFDPAKIGINSYNGYIYMLIGKQFLTLDALNRFQGLVGTEPVGFDLIDYLVRLFATDVQKEKLEKREPVSYNNFCITPDNKIYAVSMANANQIKKINSIGDSTYPAGFYGELTYDENGETVYPFFVDIAVDSYDMITVADQHNSKLYHYNDVGELLAVFGGKGSNKGSFETITSICYDTKDRLFVLDSSRNNLQVMAPTAFLQQVHSATSLYLQGKYDESLSQWNEMRQLMSSYPVAQKYIASILYKQQDYSGALQEYYEIGDKANYGKTLGALRSIFYTEHFGLVVGVVLVVAVGVVWLLLFLHKKCYAVEDGLYDHGVSRGREFGGLCLLSFYHPIRMLDLLKWRRQRVNLLPVIILPAALIVVRFIASYFTGYTVSSMEKEDVSVFYEATMVLVPYISMVLCTYAVTSVFSGEMTLYETFAAYAYSMVPMIVLWPALTLVSQVVASQEASVFLAVQGFVYAWLVWNLILSLGRLNDYSAKKTVGIFLLVLFGVGVVWVLCMLIFTFSAQLGHFISEVFQEISSRFQ